eukprot:XP_025012546.1 indole-3-acetaldehyde oxidase-like [Ricinus communis]
MEEEKEREKNSSSLVFAVNGQRFELSSVISSTTVLEFLRTHTPFKSVKLGCGEGGCGACTVLLSKYDPKLDQVDDFTISSCLTLLCSINRCSITTSEGLGNSKDGFHSIHQRFAGFHASQCGFCTPGMCMSLFGALVNAEKTIRPEPTPGFSKMTVIEAEKAIAGNLCRCTRYRPIADVCKSFASDVDMEDLGFNSFCRKGETQEVKRSRLPFYDRNHEICTFPEFLKGEVKSSLLLDSEKRCSWHQPSNFQELESLLKNHNNGVHMKLVVGNMGMGYYKESENYDKYIDIRHIPELSMIKKDQRGYEIGATVTISKVIEALNEENKGEYTSKSKMMFNKIAVHLEKVAAKFVQNTGSIGGNLVMAQRKHFPSDVATILLATNSFVNIVSGSKHEKLTLEDFMEMPPLDKKSVLVSIKIQNRESFKDTSPDNNSELLFETYRAAPRPLGNALSYMNAAFQAEVSKSKSSSEIVLNSCRLSFGAFGTRHAIRARKVEEHLTGKLLTMVVLYEAIKLVKATVVPEDGTQDPAYRSSLAVGFLFDFLFPLINTGANGWVDRDNGILMFKEAESNDKYERIDQINFPTLLSSSKQVIQLNDEYHPVGEPITKSGASLQASGEAIFVDDIPSPRNCLHGAFIYSTKPLARIKGINFKSKSLPDGVKTLLSFKDIPKGGENVGSMFVFGPEPLFAEEVTQYAGEPLAFVLADTQKHADAASKLAVVDYDLKNLEPPILSVEEAVKHSSLFEVPPSVLPKQVGDVSKGMAVADHKILSAEIKLGSQYYFYMETQTALAVPEEDNCIVVYSSIQGPELAHVTIAKCLGLPENNVRVLTRRVGGGFGGKTMKAMPAYLEAVNLSINSMFVRDSASTEYLNYGAAVSEVEIDLLTGQTTILRSDILYDCGQSLNPAVDLGQIEGAFVQGIGFFMLEEYTTNPDGLADVEGTWTYKIPTIDTIPKQFNVEIVSSGHHQKRVLSSKASGEPPLLLAASVHCAVRAAIREARQQIDSWSGLDFSNSKFEVDVPATMPKVKELCGLDSVERYLQWKMGGN